MGKKSPAGQNVADAEAAKAIQREKERKSSMYGIFRTFFELQCIYLGIEEIAALAYEEGGIIPTVTRRPFDPAEEDKRTHYMESRMRDFHNMTRTEQTSLVRDALKFIEEAKAHVESLLDEEDKADVPPPVLMDKDGVPIEAKKPEPEAEESDTAKDAPLQEGEQKE